MAVLKKYVHNRSRPEGCIAKGYGTEEVTEFCVEFIDDLNPIGVPMSCTSQKVKFTKQTSLFFRIHPSWLHIWMST
jgi:hypothetical protein